MIVFKFKFYYLFFFIFILLETNIFAKASLKQTVSGTHANDRFYRGITFNNDGTKMYVVQSQSGQSTGNGTDKVLMYDLSIPYDVSTITDNNVEQRIRFACDGAGGSPSSGDGNFRAPGGVRFNNNGTKIFFTNRIDGTNANDTCELTLTTPYDITTVKLDGANELYQGFELEAGDTDVSDTGANDAFGLAFNNNGTRLFITHYSSVFKVYQFDLSTGFDLSTSKYNDVSFSTNTDGSETPTGVQFSKDGYQMFVVDHEDDSIYQWSLSTAFDLSSTVTFRGTLNMLSDYQSHSTDTSSKTERAQDLEFNNDGSKVIVTFDYGADGAADKTSTRGPTVLIEYELDCPYGIVYCESPVSGSNKALIGVIESYTEMSKRVMKNNIHPVMHRLEWVRRHKDQNNLTNQSLKFNFSNKMISSLVNTMSMGTNLSEINKNQKGNWFFWSEGQIGFGDIKSNSRSLKKEIDTDGITFGADKKVSENKMYGYAIQYGRDSSDIGSSSAILDTDNYSLVYYGSLSGQDESFLDGAIGLSTLQTTHLRTNNLVNLTGKRDGKQVFGSIKLNKVYNKENIYINPLIRFDLGFTELDAFQESGDAHSLIYDKHQIPKGVATLGLLIDNTKIFNQGTKLKNIFRIEYLNDFSPSTNTNVSYVSDPNTDYFIRIGNQSAHNYKIGLGFDLSTNSGWSIIMNYEIQNANGNGNIDNLYLSAGWVPNNNTELNISIKNNNSLFVGLSRKVLFNKKTSKD